MVTAICWRWRCMTTCCVSGFCCGVRELGVCDVGPVVSSEALVACYARFLVALFVPWEPGCAERHQVIREWG